MEDGGDDDGLAFHGDFLVVVDRGLGEAALLKATPALEVDGELFGSQHGHGVLDVFGHVGDLNSLIDMAFGAVVCFDLGDVEVCECGITALEMQ